MKDKKPIALSKYIIFTSLAGLIVFLVSFVGLGFLAIALTWYFTRNEPEEDRVMACISAFGIGAFLQIFLMSILLNPGAPV